jgi:hypothetical protein
VCKERERDGGRRREKRRKKSSIFGRRRKIPIFFFLPTRFPSFSFSEARAPRSQLHRILSLNDTVFPL